MLRREQDVFKTSDKDLASKLTFVGRTTEARDLNARMSAFAKWVGNANDEESPLEAVLSE